MLQLIVLVMDIVYVCKAVMIPGIHVFHVAMSAPLVLTGYLVLNVVQIMFSVTDIVYV